MFACLFDSFATLSIVSAWCWWTIQCDSWWCNEYANRSLWCAVNGCSFVSRYCPVNDYEHIPAVFSVSQKVSSNLDQFAYQLTFSCLINVDCLISFVTWNMSYNSVTTCWPQILMMRSFLLNRLYSNIIFL